jgi:hypothetical protein
MCDDPLFILPKLAMALIRHSANRGRAVMPSKLSILSCFGILTIAIWAAPSSANAGIVLISAEEANLPEPLDVFPPRAITRGPHVELVKAADSQLRSPLHFQLKFRSFGGATINLNTLHLTYLRSPPLDLTPRVRPFAQPTGIDIPDAEVPPGNHLFRVDLDDSDGRKTAATFVLKVVP